ncbi:PAP-associated domain-containing protein [Plasmodiophora brassicae]
MHLLRSVVAIGILVVLSAAVRRDARRGDGPADNREHIREAVFRLEQARSSLSGAERIILSVGQSFGNDLLRIPEAPDLLGVCHQPNRPNFEAVFRDFEQRLITGTVSLMESIASTYYWIHLLADQNANNTQCADERPQRRQQRIYQDVVSQLTSTIRSWAPDNDQVKVLQSMLQSNRIPNVFAMRDANYVVLPVQHFWNVTRVQIDDLLDAVSETRRQIAASRVLLKHLSSDLIVLHEVYKSTLDLSLQSYNLTWTVLMEATCLWPDSVNKTVVHGVLTDLGANIDRWRLQRDQVAYMATLYADAFLDLDNARDHVEECRYLANLDSLLADEPVKSGKRPSRKKQLKRQRSVPQLPAPRDSEPAPAGSQLALTRSFNPGEHDVPLTATVQPTVDEAPVRQESKSDDETLDAETNRCSSPPLVMNNAPGDDTLQDPAVTCTDEVFTKDNHASGALTVAHEQHSPAISANSDNDDERDPTSVPQDSGPNRQSEGLPPGIGEFLEPPAMGGRYLENDVASFVAWVETMRHNDDPFRYIVRQQIERIAATMFPGSVVVPALSPADDLYMHSPFSGLDLTVSNSALPGGSQQHLHQFRDAVLHLPNMFVSATYASLPVPKLIISLRDSPLIVTLFWNVVMRNDFASEVAVKYPMVKPVLFYVWYFLVRHGLHGTAGGGIDWQLLQVMVVSHIQVNTDDCRAPFQGRCLRSFFTYYGTRFNYNRDCISVIGNGRVFPKAERGAMERQGLRLCAESPYDSAVDLGRHAFDIGIAVQRFKAASNLLMDYFPGQLISTDMTG